MSQFFDETSPMDYERFYTATRVLKRESQSLQTFTVGKSVLGRSITAYMIGSGRPCAVYVGTHHAMEYITAMLLFRFTEDLCRCMDSGEALNGFDVKNILSAGSVYLIPMLNPDGVEIYLKGSAAAGPLKDSVRRVSHDNTSSWQANARGIDLNRNYNAGFDKVRKMNADNGITGPAPSGFGGYHCESEPETHALCNLCRRMYFRRAFAFYSPGEEIYWKYGGRTPKNAEDIAKELSAASGYQLSVPDESAAHGGFKDWFINVFALPGFAIGVGSGQNPLPLSDFDSIYRKVLNLMLLGLVL